MHEALAKLIEDSFQIAWDYLEATGELGAPDIDPIPSWIRLKLW
jgi:hypothetical protein